MRRPRYAYAVNAIMYVATSRPVAEYRHGLGNVRRDAMKLAKELAATALAPGQYMWVWRQTLDGSSADCIVGRVRCYKAGTVIRLEVSHYTVD